MPTALHYCIDRLVDVFCLIFRMSLIGERVKNSIFLIVGSKEKAYKKAASAHTL